MYIYINGWPYIVNEFQPIGIARDRCLGWNVECITGEILSRTVVYIRTVFWNVQMPWTVVVVWDGIWRWIPGVYGERKTVISAYNIITSEGRANKVKLNKVLGYRWLPTSGYFVTGSRIGSKSLKKYMYINSQRKVNVLNICPKIENTFGLFS